MEMNLFPLLRFGGVWDCFSSGLACYLRICTFAWNGKPRNEKRKLFSLRRSQMGKRMTNSCPGRKRAAAAEVGMGKNSLLRGESGGGRRRRRGIGPAEERVEVHKMTKFNNSRKRFSCLEERLLEAALFLLDRNPLEWLFVPPLALKRGRRRWRMGGWGVRSYMLP